MFKVLCLTNSLLRLSLPVKNCTAIKLFLNQNAPIYNCGLVHYCTQNGDFNKTDIYECIRKDVDVQSLTKGDPDLERKFRVIILEADVLRQEGYKVPELSYIKSFQWEDLLKKETRSQRIKFLQFLWKIQMSNESQKRKKEQARIERESRPAYEDDGHIRYGLNHNTIYIRIYDSTINQMYNNRLIQAMQFGQKLIIDCGFGNNMTPRENSNCAKQLVHMFAANRAHDDPFDLHLCNINPAEHMTNTLGRHIGTLHEPWFPLHLHPENYLDLFPKDRLVYLTPDCRKELVEYDHDAIYIVGGIVDKMSNDPLSLAKAKRDGLKMAKLPLDRYLQWGAGSGKSLTINQMIAILLDIKSTGNWEYALRHVPRRKIVDPELSFGNKRKLLYDRSKIVDPDLSFGDKRQLYDRSTRRRDQSARPVGMSKNFIKQLMDS